MRRRVFYLFWSVVLLGMLSWTTAAQETFEIAAVTPTNQAGDVDPTAAQIVVAFDRPIVPLVSNENQDDLPQPLTLNPPINGNGEWLTTSLYVFYPSSDLLRANTAYEATIHAGLTATDGSVLATDYSWTFRTIAPQTIGIDATETFDDLVTLESGFQVSFSQPMDTAATEAAFHVWQEADDISTPEVERSAPVLVPGTIRWNERKTRLEFQPESLLLPSHTYNVELAANAVNADGSAVLTDSSQERFQTVGRPYPTMSTNEYLEAGPTRIVFSFNTYMNKDSIFTHYTIEPVPPDLEAFTNQTDITLVFTAVKDVDYTITFQSGMEDLYGYSLGKDTVFTVHTVNSQPIMNEDIKGWFSFAPRYPIVILGIYGEPPALPISARGDATITTDFYQFNPSMLDMYKISRNRDTYYSSYSLYTDALEQIDFSRDYSLPADEAMPPDTDPAWMTDDALVTSLTQTIGGEEQRAFVLPDQDTLPPGLYGLKVSPGADTEAHTQSEVNYWSADRRVTVLVISTVAISLRRSPLGALIWVTDLKTAAPVPNVTVKSYSASGSTILGTTNEEGALEIIGPIPDYVTVEDEEQYGMWLDWSPQTMPRGKSYIYTDRPIYRPGETMYFRGVVRDQADVDYTVPDFDSMTVTIRSYDYNSDTYVILDEMRLGLTQFGTVSGSWTIPADAALSSYDLILSRCGSEDSSCNLVNPYTYRQTVSFVVAEFRVPEFAVSVDAEPKEIVSGDPFTADVAADYYFGAPVSDGRVTIYAAEDYGRSSFNYQGKERGLRFGASWNWYSDGTDVVPLEVSGNTDAQGDYEVSDTISMMGSLPASVTVSTSVTDESGQTISASDQILVHPSAVYIGMRAKKYFFQADQPQLIDLFTMDINSQPTPNKTIQLDIVEEYWYRTKDANGDYKWATEEIPHGTYRVTTDDTGYASYEFNPPNTGEFHITATTMDDEGRTAATGVRFYAVPKAKTSSLDALIGGDPFIPIYECVYTTEFRALAIKSDARSYTPGDTAQIYIPNPFEGPVTALISVERGRIIDYDLVEFEGSSYTYDLSITDEHAPNVYVEVLLIQAVSDEHPDPLYERGVVSFSVEPIARRLNIEIIPSASVAKPGDEVTIQVRVTDFQGNPVQAEVGIALTDEAALAVYEGNTATLEATFYNSQPDSVSDSTSLKLLLKTPVQEQFGGCGGGGGDGGGGDAALRDDFIYTPLWTTVITNEQGIGEAKVTLPDNLTLWRIDARAVTMDTRVGQATANISTTLPLIVRPVAPRFAVAGDVMPIAAVIHNNTNDVQSITATATVEGIALEDDAPIQVDIPAHGQTRVEWIGHVQDVSSIDIQIDVVSASGLRDAARPTLRTSPDDKIPTYRYTAPDTVSTSGVLTEEGQVTEKILLPTQFTEVTGQLDIDIQTSLAAVTLESLDYLENYPYQGIEQTVSRLLPNVATYQTLRMLKISDAALEHNLTASLDEALTRLKTDQNEDGGWGWFSRMTSNPLTTAYALIGLSEARDAGLPFDAAMADRAAAYLFDQLTLTDSLRNQSWQVNRQAIVLYALALWDAPTDLASYVDALFERDAALSVSARAFLLMTYAEVAPDSASVDTLVSDFISSAVITATGAYWDESDRGGWNWDSSTRTTALVLSALTRIQPDHPLLPNAVRWLVSARQGDHWETTQETAWSVKALTDWMAVSGELDANYVYKVLLNDAMIMQQTISPDDSPVDTTLTVSTDYNSLQPDNMLVIEHGEGPGPLYYTAVLQLDLPAAEVGAFANGIFVGREYLYDRGYSVEDLEVGYEVIVRLNVTLTEDVNYFVLEDWLPAGFEPIDPQLATSDPFANGVRLGCFSPRNPYWCWASWYFDHSEMRDTGIRLYAEFLPKGAYVFSYSARVAMPGTFQAIPAQAYAFYQPEVYGRSDGMELTVR